VSSESTKNWIGQRVRTLREAAGFSQESFAAACGMHRTYMGGIERGERNITVDTLMHIAAALEITVSELVAGIERSGAESRRRRRASS
jgi:transcriptional regulator with XRE-family HTH domain